MANKKGLVLEGGGLRGLFTAGVLDCLMEEGILFDGMVGVSAGAVFGCNLKSGQKGRVLRYNTRYCRDRRYCSLYSLITTGSLFGTEFCYRLLPEELDPFDWKRYEENPMEFFAACTDVETGEATFFSCEGEKDRVMDIFRAGASMPLVSKPVTIDGRRYLDGGIADSIPLAFLEGRGYEKNLVILTRPLDYEKSRGKGGVIMDLVYGKNSGISRAMARRHEMYNAEKNYVLKRAEEKKAFLIAPPKPLPVSRVEKDPKKLYLAWEEGQKAARNALAELKEFFKESN